MDIVTLRLLFRRDGDAKLMSFYYSSYSWAEKVRDFGRHGRARQFTAVLPLQVYITSRHHESC